MIEGNGHSISGERKFRIFDVDGGILTVKNLTMAEGRGGSNFGGAIRLQNGGRATVNDSRIINNSASYGGGIHINLVGTENSWLTVNRSSFERNWGGAIYAGGGTVSVSNSSFVSNSAGRGGAINMINPVQLKVVNSSFINNYGGAISMENGVTATLTHVTIYGSAISLPKSSFTSASRVNLRNSIIAGKLDSVVCDSLKQNISNFIRDGVCSPKFSGDPMLAEATDTAAYLEPLHARQPGHQRG